MGMKIKLKKVSQIFSLFKCNMANSVELPDDIDFTLLSETAKLSNWVRENLFSLISAHSAGPLALHLVDLLQENTD